MLPPRYQQGGLITSGRPPADAAVMEKAMGRAFQLDTMQTRGEAGSWPDQRFRGIPQQKVWNPDGGSYSANQRIAQMLESPYMQDTVATWLAANTDIDPSEVTLRTEGDPGMISSLLAYFRPQAPLNVSMDIGTPWRVEHGNSKPRPGGLEGLMTHEIRHMIDENSGAASQYWMNRDSEQAALISEAMMGSMREIDRENPPTHAEFKGSVYDRYTALADQYPGLKPYDDDSYFDVRFMRSYDQIRNAGFLGNLKQEPTIMDKMRSGIASIFNRGR